jgi:hypothetical protein
MKIHFLFGEIHPSSAHSNLAFRTKAGVWRQVKEPAKLNRKLHLTHAATKNGVGLYP